MDLRQTRCPLLLVADYRFFSEMGGGSSKTTVNYLISLIDRYDQCGTLYFMHMRAATIKNTFNAIFFQECTRYTRRRFGKIPPVAKASPEWDSSSRRLSSTESQHRSEKVRNSVILILLIGTALACEDFQ